MSSEQRTSERVDAKLMVDFSLDPENVFLFNKTSNVSKAGVFISTETPLPAGTELEVIIYPKHEDPEIATHEVVIPSKVVRSWTKDEVGEGMSPGMGVQFLSMKEEDWKLIESAIREATEERPLDMDVVAGEASESIRYQLEMIGRFSENLKDGVDLSDYKRRK